MEAPEPAWNSGNLTVGLESVDFVLVLANCFVLLVTSSVGVAANMFVILAVSYQKSLQTSVNALVVNLAVVDLLRCVIDGPVLLSIIVSVHQGRRVDALICDTQTASFSFSCCIQLSTLACISAERHQAIANPFKSSHRKRRVTILIPLTWTLALVVAAVSQVFLKDSPVYLRCSGRQKDLLSSYDTFGFYVLLPLWVSCFGIIIGFYSHIFALVKSHNRKIFDEGNLVPKKSPAEKQEKTEGAKVENGLKQAANNSSAQKQAGSHRREEKSLLTSGGLSAEHHLGGMFVAPAVQKAELNGSPFIKTETKASNNGNSSNTEKKEGLSDFIAENPTSGTEVSIHEKLPASSENPTSNSVSLRHLKEEIKSNGGETQIVPTSEAPKQEAAIEGAVCIMPSKANRERARKRKESKMAKRAGYIILTFLFFWTPLISSILVNSLKHKNRKPQTLIVQDMQILFVSVTCITSLSDPIIYAAVNPQFRSELYKLKGWVRSRFNKK